MHRLLRRLAACGLLASGLMGVGAAQAQDAVQLRFAWPDGLVAQVQSQQTRSKQAGGQPPVRNQGSTQYVMSAKLKSDGKDGGNYLVSFSDLRLDEQRVAALPPEQRALAAMLAQATLPSYRVSGDGDFIAIDNLPSFQAAMRAVLAQWAPEGPAHERYQALLDAILSETALNQFAETNWNWMVGSWAGAQEAFEIGADYAATTQAVVPIVNVPITQHTRFKLARRLPCTRQGQARECVEIVAVTTPDDNELREAVAAFVARLAPKGAAPALRALTHSATLTLVTEVATLVPHQYQLRKTLSAWGPDGGVSHQVEEHEQKFSYPERPARH